MRLFRCVAPAFKHYGQGRSEGRAGGAQFHGRGITAGGAETSQQYHKYSKCASEWAQVWPWGARLAFCPGRHLTALPPLIVAQYNVWYILNSDDSVFSSMTFTLHKSEIHWYGVMPWWAACGSLVSTHLQRQGAKLGNAMFYYWPSLRNNNVATNLQNSLQVAAVGILPPVTVESRHLGRQCSETVATNSSKPNIFILWIEARTPGSRKVTGMSSCYFKRGRRFLFHYSIMGNFIVYQDRIETNLLQLFVQQENSEWLSIISVIFEVNILAEQKQKYW